MILSTIFKDSVNLEQRVGFESCFIVRVNT